MKIISMLITPVSLRKNKKFYLSPYLSQRSLDRKLESDFSTVIITFVTSIALVILFVLIGNYYLVPLNRIEIILLSPIILFLTEALGALGQILFWSTCPRSFPIHLRPLSSSSLSGFWGRHWNLWVQDWLKDVGSTFKKNRAERLIGIFLVSGLFHEIMVNLPFWLVYRRSYFGTMMAYFICQAIGVEIEKRFLRGKSPILKRVYMLLVVTLPSPLFINVPVLTFLGMI